MQTERKSAAPTRERPASDHAPKCVDNSQRAMLLQLAETRKAQIRNLVAPGPDAMVEALEARAERARAFVIDRHTTESARLATLLEATRARVEDPARVVDDVRRQGSEIVARAQGRVTSGTESRIAWVEADALGRANSVDKGIQSEVRAQSAAMARDFGGEARSGAASVKGELAGDLARFMEALAPLQTDLDASDLDAGAERAQVELDRIRAEALKAIDTGLAEAVKTVEARRQDATENPAEAVGAIDTWVAGLLRSDASLDSGVESLKALGGTLAALSAGPAGPDLEALARFDVACTQVETGASDALRQTVGAAGKGFESVATEWEAELRRTMGEPLEALRVTTGARVETLETSLDQARVELRSALDKVVGDIQGRGFWDWVGSAISSLAAGLWSGMKELGRGLLGAVTSVLIPIVVGALALLAVALFFPIFAATVASILVAVLLWGSLILGLVAAAFAVYQCVRVWMSDDATWDQKWAATGEATLATLVALILRRGAKGGPIQEAGGMKAYLQQAKWKGWSRGRVGDLIATRALPAAALADGSSASADALGNLDGSVDVTLTSAYDVVGLIASLVMPRSVGGLQGVKDLVDRAIATAKGRPIRHLEILDHASPGYQGVGNDEALTADMSAETREVLALLRPHFAEGASVTLHGCNSARGEHGKALLQTLVQVWGVPVRGGTSYQAALSGGTEGPVVTARPGEDGTVTFHTDTGPGAEAWQWFSDKMGEMRGFPTPR